MATKPKQEVAPANEEAQLPAIEQDYLNEIMADAGAGVDNMGMDDVAVPYLYVLQTNSPQTNPDHDMYIEGARAGMFLNNVTNEIFDGRETGLEVIPCAYERKMVEWVHRDDGGGYVGDHDPESNILSKCKPDEKGKPRLPNGHMIVETAYHYVYMKNPNTGRWEEIIIPMKSSALKKSRRWNKTLMSTYIPNSQKKAPRWLYPYRLKTAKETKGDNTWSNIEVERLEAPVTPDQYRAAKAFAEQFTQGAIIRARETDVSDEPAGNGKTIEQSAGEKDIDDMDGKIPF